MKNDLNRLKKLAGLTESIVGNPEKKHVGAAGMGGGYSAAEDEATTIHQLGSKKYKATTEQDGDGDMYYHIYDEAGNKLYSAMSYPDGEDFQVSEDKLGKAISTKIMNDHRKATDHMFRDEDEDF